MHVVIVVGRQQLINAIKTSMTRKRAEKNGRPAERQLLAMTSQKSHSSNPTWPIFVLVGIIGSLSIAYMFYDGLALDHDEVAVAGAIFLLLGVIVVFILQPSFPSVINPIINVRFRWIAIAAIIVGGALVLTAFQISPGPLRVVLEGLGYPPLSIGVLAIIAFLTRQMR